MPDVGRFFNVDPLSEKYSYNGVYNFSENRVVNSRELEGLEALDNKGNFESIKDASDFAKNTGGYVVLSDSGIPQVTHDIEEVVVQGKAKGGYVSFDKTSESEGTTSYHAMSTGYNTNGEYAGFESNIKMFSGTYTNTTGSGALPLAVDLSGGASAMSANISGRLGTTNNSIFGNANGSMWSANANLSAGIFTGESQKTGLLADGNIGAYGLKGEISGGVTLFGVSMQGTLGGTLGSAHIGGTGGFYYDGKSGAINITLQENIGFGAGEKAAINLQIPVPFIKK